MRNCKGAYKITYANENGEICTDYQTYVESISDEFAQDILADLELIYILIGKDITRCTWLMQFDILHVDSLDFHID